MNIEKYVTLENALQWSRLGFVDSFLFVVDLLESETKSASRVAELDFMLYKYAKRNISLATFV